MKALMMTLIISYWENSPLMWCGYFSISWANGPSWVLICLSVPVDFSFRVFHVVARRFCLHLFWLSFAVSLVTVYIQNKLHLTNWTHFSWPISWVSYRVHTDVILCTPDSSCLDNEYLFWAIIVPLLACHGHFFHSIVDIFEYVELYSK